MPDATERKCLKCLLPFMSTRPKSKHRICPPCDKGKRSTKNTTRRAGPYRRGGESRMT